MEILEILKKIDPADCDYQEWLTVGMALKHEGYSPADWDNWSRADSRYHAGECERKWESFAGNANPVTGGSIVQLARERGLLATGGDGTFEWDDEISYEGGECACEGIPIREPADWQPVQELVTYLSTLFEAGENVGYVTETYESDDEGKRRYLPTRGCWDRTAGELIALLNNCGGDIGAVIGDCKEEAGAWIRFNPLDGKGIKNENVTDFRYALVESDSMPIERQNAVMRELELPIALLVYSGGKSLHAIVKIDAPNYEEYRKRVDYLYKVCKKNGLAIDPNNRNPSRLSRMPGVIRNGKKQFIVDKSLGKESFEEWREYIESINDDLPDIENFADEMDDLPELAPELIKGVLRYGHKMLLAGPSKAGKSYALIELCVAIAEGKEWLGFECAKGKVFYVNLELDKASCLRRFDDVYKAMGIKASNHNIDIWNLRGYSVPMDVLAPVLIRRAAKRGYIAVVIDPIYKVITGDENSADQMAHFCNQFDRICTELGCAVIYCHHHSKGAQGGKRSMDRASGSGVFARDPDALLDLSELTLTEPLRAQQQDAAACRICENWIRRFYRNADELLSPDDLVTPTAMLDIAHKYLRSDSYSLMCGEIERAGLAVRNRTAWRIEGTLREFPKFAPLNVWFDFPVHRADTVGVLADLAVDEAPSWQKNFEKKRTPKERSRERKESIETAFSGVQESGKCRISELAEYLAVTEKTVRSRLKEHGGFWVDDGECGLKENGKSR